MAGASFQMVIILGESARASKGWMHMMDSQRRIPRHNSCTHANRLAARVRKALRNRHGHPVDLVRPAGKVPQRVDRLRHMQAHRVAIQDPSINSLERRQVLRVALDQVGQLVDQAAPRLGGLGLPGLVGPLGGRDGAVDIFGLGGGDGGEVVARGGVLEGEGCGVCGGGEGVVDEEAGRDWVC